MSYSSPVNSLRLLIMCSVKLPKNFLTVNVSESHASDTSKSDESTGSANDGTN